MQLDKQLLKKLKKHDKKTQLKFYEQCFGVMMSAARRYEKNVDDAAFLVNESFLKVLTNIDKYKESTPLEAWLRRIVINTAINNFKKSAKFRETFQDRTVENENITSLVSFNDADATFEIEEVERILKKLPKATLLVFNMYAMDGYSYQDVSDELGITVETSKWHVKEARKRLRAIISENSELLLIGIIIYLL